MKVDGKKLIQQALKKFKVKAEKQATRCEICHQSDQFDPINNICRRCNNIAVPAKSDNTVNNVTESVTQPNITNNQIGYTPRINLWSFITVKLHIVSIIFLTIPLLQNRRNVAFTAPVQGFLGLLVIFESFKNGANYGAILGISAIVFNIFLYLLIVPTKMTSKEARQIVPIVEFGYLCFCLALIFMRTRPEKPRE